MGWRRNLPLEKCPSTLPAVPCQKPLLCSWFLNGCLWLLVAAGGVQLERGIQKPLGCHPPNPATVRGATCLPPPPQPIPPSTTRDRSVKPGVSWQAVRTESSRVSQLLLALTRLQIKRKEKNKASQGTGDFGVLRFAEVRPSRTFCPSPRASSCDLSHRACSCLLCRAPSSRAAPGPSSNI